jgi:hypothetical protein
MPLKVPIRTVLLHSSSFEIGISLAPRTFQIWSSIHIWHVSDASPQPAPPATPKVFQIDPTTPSQYTFRIINKIPQPGSKEMVLSILFLSIHTSIASSDLVGMFSSTRAGLPDQDIRREAGGRFRRAHTDVQGTEGPR